VRVVIERLLPAEQRDATIVRAQDMLAEQRLH
jgi:hypothetical protein